MTLIECDISIQSHGGVPICFPQFGNNGPLRQHDFARNMPWTLHSISDDKTTAVFTLKSTEDTLSSDWPYAFHVPYTIFRLAVCISCRIHSHIIP